jgi:hypothetical protein
MSEVSLVPNGAGLKAFPSILRESVVVALSDVLGSAGARAALYYVDLSDIADVKKIHRGLVDVFGAGAAALEAAILRELFSRLGYRFDPEESQTFADYINDAKKMVRRKAPRTAA